MAALYATRAALSYTTAWDTICTDISGNVFIANLRAQDIVEYAHGGTKPINTIDDPDNPYSCAIDAITGNLAVVNFANAESEGQGNLAVYPDGQGPPTIYTAGYGGNYFSCAYDSQGDLLVDYVDYSGGGFFYFYMLPRGGSKLRFVRFGASSGDLGRGATGINWDGKFWAIGINQKVYRFIAGHNAKRARIHGETTLSGVSGSAALSWYTLAHISDAIGGANHLLATEDYPDGVGIWNYPKGGSPLATIKANVNNPMGVVVSLTP